MRLFTYLSKGEVRSARLAGELGINIALSCQLYARHDPAAAKALVGYPLSLRALFLSGAEGMHLVSEATDWVLSSAQISGLESDHKPVIFRPEDVTILAPIPRPGKVICVAGNYPSQVNAQRPDFPTIFLKPSGGVIGDHQAIILPAIADSVAYEVELAIVIGKRGRNISHHQSQALIAGFTMANDLGDRLLEKRTSQWTSGKMFDTFTPMGPYLVTPDELGDPGDLAIFTKVNDQIVQKGNTADMFFDVPTLVCYLSTLTTLEVGDVILTGSPKLMDNEPNPVVSLLPGDTVRVGVAGLGTLTNPVISEYEANS